MKKRKGASLPKALRQQWKPLFIAGPHDNAKEILKQLELTAGPGNYHYMVMAPPDMY